MDARAPGTIAGFAEVRARLLSGAAPADVTLGSDGGSLRMMVGRAAVAIVEAGAPLPDGADVVLIVGAEPAIRSSLSAASARRVQVLPLPCTNAMLDVTLQAAAEAAEAFARSRLADRLLEIGLALNAERDPDRVLRLILHHARSITHADAGSIYLVEDEGKTLRFAITENDSVDAPLEAFTMPVTDRSIVGTSVLTGRIIRIADLYASGESQALGRVFVHDSSFDERFGYQTRSMITTPMISPDGRVLAVIQLINARVGARVASGTVVGGGKLATPHDFRTRVRPFTDEDERLCSSLAAQAAVALESARLYAEIQKLFEGFVRASVLAIEQRDPTTSGHSQRVADLTVDLAKAADRVPDGRFGAVTFSPDELREIQYAGLLHDFGKVGVREEVLVKAKKLYPHQLELVLARFDHMRTTLQLELLQERFARLQRGQAEDARFDEAHASRMRHLEEMAAVVLEANEPTVLPREVSGRLAEVAAVTFRGPSGEPLSVLTPVDLDALLIQRGSLTEGERIEIQSHVTHTYNFLVRIPWGATLRRVPEIAGKHHEYLDGTGYPTAAHAEEIPLQARMMTVSDIFDALTASDRPYKRAVPIERALDILEGEVGRGKVDGEVLRLFIDAKVYARAAS
jgi:HD-GYP domain-containing protein (c-di-GMP phosphodiesterase class II)